MIYPKKAYLDRDLSLIIESVTAILYTVNTWINGAVLYVVDTER